MIHVHQICLLSLISTLFWARRAVIAIDWEPLVNPNGETPGMTEQGRGGGNGFLQISDGDVQMRRTEAECNKSKGENNVVHSCQWAWPKDGSDVATSIDFKESFPN